jgi:hypothetical protein
MVPWADGQSTDEEGGMGEELEPGIVRRYAILAVRVSAGLFYGTRVEAVDANPEG